MPWWIIIVYAIVILHYHSTQISQEKYPKKFKALFNSLQNSIKNFHYPVYIFILTFSPFLDSVSYLFSESNSNPYFTIDRIVFIALITLTPIILINYATFHSNLNKDLKNYKKNIVSIIKPILDKTVLDDMRNPYIKIPKNFSNTVFVENNIFSTKSLVLSLSGPSLTLVQNLLELKKQKELSYQKKVLSFCFFIVIILGLIITNCFTRTLDFQTIYPDTGLKIISFSCLWASMYFIPLKDCLLRQEFDKSTLYSEIISLNDFVNKKSEDLTAHEKIKLKKTIAVLEKEISIKILPSKKP